MENDSNKILYGIHSGDIYYKKDIYRYNESCFIKKRVLSEPEYERDGQGIEIWTFEEEELEALFFYRDLYGCFQIYKSIKIEENAKEKPTYQIKNGDNYTFLGYANNPIGTPLDDLICIVFHSNDSSVDVAFEVIQRYIRWRGIWDYVEVADEKDRPGYVDPNKYLWRRRLKLGLFILASFVYLYYFTNWPNFLLVCFVDLISIGIYSLWNSSWGETEYKTNRGNMIKKVLEYDFGDDYKMLVKGSQQSLEHLYLLSEGEFEKLKTHLNSIPDGEFQKKGVVTHETDKNNTIIGFTLSERRLNDGCGNTETIHVDYMDKTLKYSFVIY